MIDPEDDASDDTSEPEGFPLSEEGRRVVADLIDFLRDVAGRVDSGETLIGVGEAWAALETIEEATPDVNVGVVIGHREGDADFREGTFYECRVDWDGIRLDVLRTVWSRDVGGDHSSEVIASCGRNGTLRGDPEHWLAEARRLLETPGATVRTSRDHV